MLQLVTTNIHLFLHLKKLGCCLLILEMWGGQIRGGDYSKRNLKEMRPERNCTQRNVSLNHSPLAVLLKFHFTERSVWLGFWSSPEIWGTALLKYYSDWQCTSSLNIDITGSTWLGNDQDLGAKIGKHHKAKCHGNDNVVSIYENFPSGKVVNHESILVCFYIEFHSTRVCMKIHNI